MNNKTEQFVNDHIGFLVLLSVIFTSIILHLLSVNYFFQEPLQTPRYLKDMSCSQLEDVLETGSQEAEQNVYISNLMQLKGCRL